MLLTAIAEVAIFTLVVVGDEANSTIDFEPAQ
jgi:hypothetical protein